MTLASALIARVRIRLDEPTAKFWTDPELINYMNEGMRDAGRYTRHIRDKATAISMVSGTAEYTVASNIIEIEKAYYLPGDGRQIPLTGQSYDNMDSVWGSHQNLQTGQPVAFAVWGTPPTLKIKLFPAPDSSSATLSLLVTRLPTAVTAVGDTVDWPPAWEDVIEDYMEMAALRKARDPRWQEAFNFYTAKRDNLDVNGDYTNDPDTWVFDGYAGILPRWLVEG
jgi:hypothetical protein